MNTNAIEQRLATARRAAVHVQWQDLLRFGAVVGAYVGCAKIGLDLSVAHGAVTPVWAPTGIALAALILFGRRFWPAITIGAFVANVTGGEAVAVSLALAIGNTLEAVVGRELLVRARFRPALDRVRDVFALIILAAAASTTVSATVGVTSLWIADRATDSYGTLWSLWWIGDAMGDVVVAPLLLVLATAPLRTLVRGRRGAEAAILLALLAGASCFVFLAGYWRYPHLLFPLYIWATLRFVQVGAVTSSFVVAAIAIAGAVGGDTPLAHTATDVVLVLEGLLAGITISVLILGAVLSERRLAEVQLAEAQEVARIGSWSWDIPTDRITWSNELYHLYGTQPREEITYERFLACVHPDDRVLTRATITKALKDRKAFTFEHRVLAPDDQVRWMSARGRVLVDAHGKPMRMLGTSQDVTERKQVDELRDTILAAVSHELRTPLTAIIGFAATLRERHLDSELRGQLLGHLLEQAQKLHNLLSDLLDLDRLRHGHVQPTFERVDVSRLVERTVEGRRDGRHEITLELAPAIAEVDVPKVERIVDNLVANAIRHTPADTEILVRVQPDDSGVVIAVDDHGPGVPADERETIFEAFRRGADAGSTPGTGIGLSLVARFTDLHGGRVWVEESVAGGASFRVFLPARQAAR